MSSLLNIKRTIEGYISYSDNMKDINEREKKMVDMLEQCNNGDSKKFMIKYWRFTQELNGRVYDVHYTEKLSLLVDNVDKRVTVLNELESDDNFCDFCNRIKEFDFQKFLK